MEYVFSRGVLNPGFGKSLLETKLTDLMQPPPMISRQALHFFISSDVRYYLTVTVNQRWQM